MIMWNLGTCLQSVSCFETQMLITMKVITSGLLVYNYVSI